MTLARVVVRLPEGQRERLGAVRERYFRETSRRAKESYEAADWQGQLSAVRDRVQFYDDRVNETVQRLHEEFNAESIDDATWQTAKLQYIGLLINHKQPELAETFFNSVTTKILHRDYFNNAYIFTRPAISTDYIESFPPTYSSYYPQDEGLRATIRRIIEDFDWQRPFEDLDRDVNYVMRTVEKHLGEWPKMEVNCQIQVLYSAFYRNKTAYIIGKAINGYQETPFVIAVRHGASGMLYLDTVLLDIWRISLLFSLSRAYFLVDMEVPSGYVQFLRSIMPTKPRSELYTMLGLGKQGKTIFFRDLIAHLRHSNDQFIEAPGIRGLVMLVFTLPSYPYVFKIIKDVFGSSKNMDRATVKQKYLLVRQVDRVGRMADTLEFSNVALPRSRFHPDLIAQLRQLAPSVIEEAGDTLVVKHLYIERRMIPLNLYLNNLLDCNRNFNNSLNQDFFVDDPLMSLLLELRNVDLDDVLCGDWIILVDDIFDWDLSDSLHRLRSLSNVSSGGWVDLVYLNVMIDILRDRNLNDLLHGNWIFNNVIDSFFYDVVDVNWALDDVLNRSLDDLFLDYLVWNRSLDNILNVDRALDDVFNWLLDNMFYRDLHCPLDDVVDVSWLLNNVLDWTLNDSLNRDFHYFLARDIDDFLNDVLIVDRVLDNSVLLVDDDFSWHDLGIWIMVELVDIDVQILIMVNQIFVDVLDLSFYHTLVRDFDVSKVLNWFLDDSFDWDLYDFLNWNLDDLFYLSLHNLLDFDLLLDNFFDWTFDIDVVLHVNVAFVWNPFLDDDFDLFFDDSFLDDWIILPCFNRSDASSGFRSVGRDHSFLESIFSDIDNSFTDISLLDEPGLTLFYSNDVRVSSLSGLDYSTFSNVHSHSSSLRVNLSGG